MLAQSAVWWTAITYALIEEVINAKIKNKKVSYKKDEGY
jgi:hypothetical protein